MPDTDPGSTAQSDQGGASIAGVLAGSESYDLLSEGDQAAVRDAWTVAMDARLASLNLAVEFAVSGRSYVELDEDGVVVHRGVDPS